MRWQVNIKKRPEDLYKARKKPSKAKKVAIYLLKRLTALTNREIGELFSISYSVVSKATSDMERLSKENQKVKREINRLLMGDPNYHKRFLLVPPINRTSLINNGYNYPTLLF